MPLYRAAGSTLANLVAADNNTSGFIKDTEGWRVIGASGVAVPLTGSTNETALATITIPAGAMGPNGALRATIVTSYTNSGNNKTFRYRLGGIAGTVLMAVPTTTTASQMMQRIIQNRNAQNSQISAASAVANAFGSSSASPATGAVDTSAAQDLVISGQLADAGETMTLESYIVELKYGA
jgi:hypothetical protein